MSFQSLAFPCLLHYAIGRTCVCALQRLSYCVQSRGTAQCSSFRRGCCCCCGFLSNSCARGSYLSECLLFKFDRRNHYGTGQQEQTHFGLRINLSRSQLQLASLRQECSIVIVELALTHHLRCKVIMKSRGCGSFELFAIGYGRVANSILHRITLHQFQLHLRYQDLGPTCFVKQAHRSVPVLPQDRLCSHSSPPHINRFLKQSISPDCATFDPRHVGHLNQLGSLRRDSNQFAYLLALRLVLQSHQPVL